jgi:DNA-directed RNA polymerase specialized sigma24 family protein
VILQAAKADSDESQKALSLFSEAYWPPLYTFIRRRGYPSSEAQDLTQSFFVYLLEHDTLSRSDQTRGRLRTFLLKSLENFLANEHKYGQRVKRGGGRQIISIDDDIAQVEAAMATTTDFGPFTSYDILWASHVAERAWKNLEKSLTAQGDPDWLKLIEPFIAGGDGSPPNQEEVASRLRIPVATLRTWISRLRIRYRQCLRMEIASTVSNQADVDEELHYLYELLLR